MVFNFLLDLTRSDGGTTFSFKLFLTLEKNRSMELCVKVLSYVAGCHHDVCLCVLRHSGIVGRRHFMF